MHGKYTLNRHTARVEEGEREKHVCHPLARWSKWRLYYFYLERTQSRLVACSVYSLEISYIHAFDCDQKTFTEATIFDPPSCDYQLPRFHRKRLFLAFAHPRPLRKKML